MKERKGWGGEEGLEGEEEEVETMIRIINLLFKNFLKKENS